MIGFLLKWPTIPTLVRFPILVWVHIRLARSEEREVATEFGEAWHVYAAGTPPSGPSRAGSADRSHPRAQRPPVRPTAHHREGLMSGLPGYAEAVIVLGVLIGVTVVLMVPARANRNRHGPHPK